MCVCVGGVCVWVGHADPEKFKEMCVCVCAWVGRRITKMS